MDAKSDGGSEGIFAEINVTPLVDVMLVLLIIFMVTAPLMVSSIGVDLPEGKGAAPTVNQTPLTITIGKDEKVRIADKVFTLPELEVFLKESPRVKNNEPIFIEADEATRHGSLVAVMSHAYQAGATKLNIVMEEP